MMRLNAKAVLPVALAALLLAGCGMLKKKQPDPAPSATVAAAPLVAPAPTPVAAPVEPEAAIADEAIATPEDFEDEAFEKVSDKTYKSELDSLKKEIEAK